MKFDILDRKIEFGLNNLVLMAGAMLLAGFLIVMPDIISSFISAITQGSEFKFTLAEFIGGSQFSPFLLAILAIITLVFTEKKDVGYCRSMTVAYLICSSFLFLLNVSSNLDLFTTPSGPGPIGITSFYLSQFLGYVFNSIVFYLWLLIFLKIDKEQLEKTSFAAIAFTITIFLLELLSKSVFAAPGIIVPVMNASLFFSFVVDVIWAFPLLYHYIGRKTEKKDVVVVVGIYLASAVLYSSSWIYRGSFIFSDSAWAVVDLITLYAVSRINLKSYFEK